MWSEVQKSKKILVIPPLSPNTGSACTAAAFSSCHEHTWHRVESLSNNVAWKLLTINLLCFKFAAYLSREKVQEETNVSLRESDVMLLHSSHFSFFNLVAIKCKIVSSKHWRWFSLLGHLSPAFLFIPPAIKYNVSIAERRFNPRAILDNPSKMQLQNLTLLPGEETCEHIYFHVMVRNLTEEKSI